MGLPKTRGPEAAAFLTSFIEDLKQAGLSLMPLVNTGLMAPRSLHLNIPEIHFCYPKNYLLHRTRLDLSIITNCNELSKGAKKCQLCKLQALRLKHHVISV